MVTYKPGSQGTGGMIAESKYFGRPLELLGEAYDREDYVQSGWTLTDGNTANDYELGGSYTEDADITLYPVWTELHTVTLNVSTGIKGFEISTDGENYTPYYDPIAVQNGSSLYIRALLENGYRFVTWDDTLKDNPQLLEDITRDYSFLPVTSRVVIDDDPVRESGGRANNIKVIDGVGGDAAADRYSAAAGSTVTVKYNFLNGMQFDAIAAKVDGTGAEVRLTRNEDGSYSFTMPAGSVTVTVDFKTIYSDVKDTDWFYEPVQYMAANWIMTGISEKEFAPNVNTDRASIWQIMYNMNKLNKSNLVEFKAWYDTARQWSMENALTDGTRPEATVSRQELATMLWRYAKFKGYDTAQSGMAIRDYADYDKISDWALEGMTWAVNAGIIIGKAADTLDPQGLATRAEVAAMLMRFCQSIMN